MTPLIDYAASVNNGRSGKRDKSHVVRFVNYKLDTDPMNYYRERILLYLPWYENEPSVDECMELYNANKSQIKSTRNKYKQNNFEEKYEEIEKENDMKRENEYSEYLENHTSPYPNENETDEIMLSGHEVKDDEIIRMGDISCKIFDDDSTHLKSIRMANREQNILMQKVMWQLNHCEDCEQLRLFVTRPAGCGKSFTIKCSTQIILNHYYYSECDING